MAMTTILSTDKKELQPYSDMVKI